MSYEVSPVPDRPGRTQAVFADPSGRRRVAVRTSAVTLALAGVTFIAGAGLLLSNQPSMTAADAVSGPTTVSDPEVRQQLPAVLPTQNPLVAPKIPRPGTTLPVTQSVMNQLKTTTATSTAVNAMAPTDPLQPPQDESPTPRTPGRTPTSPVTPPPVTQPPVTEPPVTQPPVTEPPVTEPPVTEPPVTEPPAEDPGPLEGIVDPLASAVGAILRPLL